MNMPKAWVKATAKKVVVSRLDMSENVAGAGLCPECKVQMSPVVANNINGYACHKDRIFIPSPNKE